MVYILLADKFEEMEAVVPFDMLKRGQIGVKFVSVNDELVVESARGVKVICDCKASELYERNWDKMEMLVIPGGKIGVENLDKSAIFDKILDIAVKNDIYIAAICAGPSLLGKRGLLAGKNAVAYPDFQEFLNGATIINERVIVDGKIITSIGAGASVEFGLKLVEILSSRETAEKIKESIY